MRVLWLPENPLVEPEPLDLELRELCREKSEAAGVEFYDMTDAGRRVFLRHGAPGL